jgi:hypothetical protein
MPPLLFEMGGNARLLLDTSLPRFAKEMPSSLRATAVPLPKSGAIQTSKWDEFLVYIADRFELNVFADAYPGFDDIDDRPTEYDIKVKKGERFSELLDSCGSWGRDWRQMASDGKDILVRLPDWFEYRDGGATQRLLDRLLKNGKQETVRVELQDWIEISALPMKQISRVSSALGVDTGWMKTESHVLEFLRGLSTSQKADLTGKGLVISAFPVTLRQSFQEMMDGKSAFLASLPEDSKPVITLVNEGESSLLLLKASRSNLKEGDAVELISRLPCRVSQGASGRTKAQKQVP